jgi:hypothetical protein
MKYAVMTDYRIEDVFDTMTEAVAEMKWRKDIGYNAYIEIMPEDTMEFRQALVDRQGPKFEAMHKDEDILTRITAVRKEEGKTTKNGFLILGGTILLLVLAMTVLV